MHEGVHEENVKLLTGGGARGGIGGGGRSSGSSGGGHGGVGGKGGRGGNGGNKDQDGEAISSPYMLQAGMTVQPIAKLPTCSTRHRGLLPLH
ncbi:hypothetical protein MRB53_018240 [Persea americana]|uniref:Uncharacterized protein n=1 Tax=Persea americana TaxID=3435 RepID=A0ACC2M6W5_PERAE|nr:hypothetical protein MRB53_018240 [Persea americana]